MGQEFHHCNDECPDRAVLIEAVEVYKSLFERISRTAKNEEQMFRSMIVLLLNNFKLLKGKTGSQRKRVIKNAMELFLPYVDRFMDEPYGLNCGESFIGATLMAYTAVKEMISGEVVTEDHSVYAAHIAWFVKGVGSKRGMHSIKITTSEDSLSSLDSPGRVNLQELLQKGKRCL